MDPNVSTLERAFQLAATGRYLTVTEIRLQLSREGYRHELVDGPTLAKQLLAAMTKARAVRAAKADKAARKTGRRSHRRKADAESAT
jgi:hypothetical protein